MSPQIARPLNTAIASINGAKNGGLSPAALALMDARVKPGHDKQESVIQEAPQLPRSTRMLQLP
jgi:hypothetical protein